MRARNASLSSSPGTPGCWSPWDAGTNAPSFPAHGAKTGRSKIRRGFRWNGSARSGTRSEHESSTFLHRKAGADDATLPPVPESTELVRIHHQIAHAVHGADQLAPLA